MGWGSREHAQNTQHVQPALGGDLQVTCTSSSSTYYNDTSSSSFLVNQPFIDELAAVGRSFGWETLCPSLTAMIQHARDNNACCDVDVSTLGCKVLYKQLAIVLVKAL